MRDKKNSRTTSKSQTQNKSKASKTSDSKNCN